MIDKIVPIVLQVVAVAGGAFVGVSMRPDPAPMVESGDYGEEEGKKEGAKKDKDKKGDKKDKDKKKDKGDKKDKKKDKNKKKDKDKKDKKKKDKGGDEEDGYGEAAGFIKFSRQFIVPVINSDGPGFVVVLDLNIESSSSGAASAYSLEPKLRDVLLKSLFKLSNSGAFGEDILKEENLTKVRAELLTAAQKVIGEDAQDILILNIARQQI